MVKQKKWMTELCRLQSRNRHHSKVLYCLGFHVLSFIHKALEESTTFWSMAIQLYHKNGYSLSSRRRKGRPRKIFRKPPPQSISLDTFNTANLFSLTGVDNTDFRRIYGGISSDIENRGPKRKSKKSFTVLTTPARLAAVFYYLKHYPSRNDMSRIFRVHWKTLWLDRKHILPILGSYLFSHSKVGWPLDPDPVFKWKENCGAIDCSSSNRNRVHPGHSFFYRGDKHTTFLSVQLVVDLSGAKILHYSIVRGHNNDQGLNFFFSFIYFFLI
jgi:hypothetical protein